MTSQQKFTTLRGYVVALPNLGKHDGGEEAKVAVHDENGLEYLVLPRGMGIDLVEHINARVEVSGILQERNGQAYIQIRQFKAQDEYDDKWYDDEA